MGGDIPDAKRLADELVAVDNEIRDVDVLDQVVALLATNISVLEKSIAQFHKRLDARRERILAHQKQ